MFCPQCGNQNPDGTAFCSQCGAAMTTSGVQSDFNAGQPSFGAGDPSVNAQPTYFPNGENLVFTPVKKSNNKLIPIIAGVCVVVAAFLIILFNVILPGSGMEGKLRHKWSVTESGVTVSFDFKNSQVSMFGASFDMDWKLISDDRLKITMSMLGMEQSMEYSFSISSDGKTLTLAPEDSPSETLDLMRDD